MFGLDWSSVDTNLVVTGDDSGDFIMTSFFYSAILADLASKSCMLKTPIFVLNLLYEVSINFSYQAILWPGTQRPTEWKSITLASTLWWAWPCTGKIRTSWPLVARMDWSWLSPLLAPEGSLYLSWKFFLCLKFIITEIFWKACFLYRTFDNHKKISLFLSISLEKV